MATYYVKQELRDSGPDFTYGHFISQNSNDSLINNLNNYNDIDNNNNNLGNGKFNFKKVKIGEEEEDDVYNKKGGAGKKVNPNKTKEVRRKLKNVLDLVCRKYNTTVEACRMPMKNNRKVTYLLNLGSVDYVSCFIRERKDESILIPNNYTVCFEANSHVWIGRIKYFDRSTFLAQANYDENHVARFDDTNEDENGSLKMNDEAAFFEVAPVDSHGNENKGLSSGFQDNISCAFKVALQKMKEYLHMNAIKNDKRLENSMRPNGRLYIGIYYETVQQKLREHMLDKLYKGELNHLSGLIRERFEFWLNKGENVEGGQYFDNDLAQVDQKVSSEDEIEENEHEVNITLNQKHPSNQIYQQNGQLYQNQQNQNLANDMMNQALHYQNMMNNQNCVNQLENPLNAAFLTPNFYNGAANMMNQNYIFAAYNNYDAFQQIHDANNIATNFRAASDLNMTNGYRVKENEFDLGLHHRSHSADSGSNNHAQFDAALPARYNNYDSFSDNQYINNPRRTIHSSMIIGNHNGAPEMPTTPIKNGSKPLPVVARHEQGKKRPPLIKKRSNSHLEKEEQQEVADGVHNYMGTNEQADDTRFKDVTEAEVVEMLNSYLAKNRAENLNKMSEEETERLLKKLDQVKAFIALRQARQSDGKRRRTITNAENARLHNLQHNSLGNLIVDNENAAHSENTESAVPPNLEMLGRVPSQQSVKSTSLEDFCFQTFEFGSFQADSEDTKYHDKKDSEINYDELESVNLDEFSKQNLVLVNCKMTAEGLFLLMAENKDKSLGFSELNKEVKRCLKIPVASEIVRRLCNACDVNKDGKISFTEFVNYLEAREEELMAMFQKMDLNNDKFVTLDELKVAREKGIFDASDEELKSLIQWMESMNDANKDGKIEFDEFKAALVLFPPATQLQDVIYCLRQRQKESEKFASSKLSP